LESFSYKCKQVSGFFERQGGKCARREKKPETCETLNSEPGSAFSPAALERPLASFTLSSL